MRHKALESYPGVYVSLLIVTVFLGSAQGGAVGTRLIFPDLTQAPSVAVGYAVLNPLAQATEVTFTAYGVGGALLDGPGVTNPVTLDVGPRSQLARFPADLFGFALDSEVTGWMEVTSDSEEIKGFFITLEDGLDGVASQPVQKLLAPGQKAHPVVSGETGFRPGFEKSERLFQLPVVAKSLQRLPVGRHLGRSRHETEEEHGG